jgi:hypothetical protein
LGNTAYDFNISGNNYVAWQWRASNATAVTNTAGSITSSVSANTTTGFSVVTYTGNGVGGATIGHGLGVVPKMVIVKRRSPSGTDWSVWHTGIGTTQYLILNGTIAAVTDSTVFNGTFNSSVFSVGSWAGINGNTNTFVAYCWSEVAGYSKFGSYTGNGSSDGPFVYLGFRPRFILTKGSSTTGSWWLYDTSRSTFNEMTDLLRPDTSNADVTQGFCDGLSNGFKIRNTGNNNSGQTYIYMAFAENPFAYANAR